MLGTGEPPFNVTLRPVVGVVAVMRVPAAMGFRRGDSPIAVRPGLASATMKLSVPAAPPPYQVSLFTRVNWFAVDRSVGEFPVWRMILEQLAAKPVVDAHSGLAAEVDKTVSTARRT